MHQVQMLSTNSIEDQKKRKVFTAIWYYTRPEFCDLFVLIATFSSNHPDAYSQWRERWNLVRGDAEISIGDANSRWGNASPYNLSTGCCRCIAYLSSGHWTTSGTVTNYWTIRTLFIHWLLRAWRNPNLLRSFQWSINVGVDFFEFISTEFAALFDATKQR